jgi:hypothetical protein
MAPLGNGPLRRSYHGFRPDRLAAHSLLTRFQRAANARQSP